MDGIVNRLRSAIERDQPDKIRTAVGQLQDLCDSPDMLVEVGFALDECLLVAAAAGTTSCLTLLLEGGADVNTRVHHYAAPPLLVACRHGHFRFAFMLIKQGADPNISDFDQETPVMTACRYGDWKMLDMLCGAGGNVNAFNYNCDTPLILACSVPEGRTEGDGFHLCVRQLLSRDVDLDHVNKQGYSALMKACTAGCTQMVQDLVYDGANMDLMDPQSYAKFAGDLHLGVGGLLITAILSSTVDMVLLVLDLAPPHLLQQWKYNARMFELVMCADTINTDPFNSYDAYYTAVDMITILSRLIGLGWSVTENPEYMYLATSDAQGRPRDLVRYPLHHAAISQHPEVIQLFIDLYQSRGLSLECEDAFTPLHQACLAGRPLGVQRLLAAGADHRAREHRGELPITLCLAKAKVSLMLMLYMQEEPSKPVSGEELRAFAHVARHADASYMTEADVDAVLGHARELVDFGGRPVPAKNVPLLCSAVMVLVAALYVACPHKAAIRRLLSMMKALMTRDERNDVMITYRLEETARFRHVMEPVTLKMAARDAARRALHEDVPRKLDALPPDALPKELRDYANLSELDHLVREYCSYDYDTSG